MTDQNHILGTRLDATPDDLIQKSWMKKENRYLNQDRIPT